MKIKLNNILQLLAFGFIITNAAYAMDNNKDNNKKRKRDIFKDYDLLADEKEIKKLKLEAQKFLIEAIEEDDIDRVRCLLALDSSPNKTYINENDNELIPLHIAVAENHPEIVTLLLETGANINQVNESSGYTALHVAVHNNYSRMVRLLIQHKANINNTDDFDETPLDLAQKQGNKQIQALLLLEQFMPLVTKNKEQAKQLLEQVIELAREHVEELEK